MDTVDEFIGRYLREYDFYAQAARLVSDFLKSDLNAAGVRAIVTDRAKDVRRLETKCRQRQRRTPYKTVNNIYDDIVDLAGVRIALYFPGDRHQVDQTIKNLFKLLVPPKTFPEDRNDRKGKRFTGYSAAHYRVQLKEESLPDSAKRYANARVEIQVASVLMHAWAEVEHDLAYKPSEGALSEEEEAILDELNGLVLAGEIALERLQKAGKARSSTAGRQFANHYDLAAYLLDRASAALNGPVSDSGIGRVDYLFDLLRELRVDTPEKLSPYIQALHSNFELRPLAEQVVDELLTEDPSRYKVYRDLQAKYLGGKRHRDESPSLVEIGRFITNWVTLENLVRQFFPDELQQKHFAMPTTRKLASLNILEPALVGEIDALRNLRNQLVHGHRVQPPNVIASANEVLEIIVAKLQAAQKEEPGSP
ncbi:RelA/SpoT domain-containing protein [Luedemannella helvata]|uniref:GTP pyrophosphokinase n=1 Tax=Luedemannella helvata TaxID=349315 RepID=UPI0031E19AEE